MRLVGKPLTLLFRQSSHALLRPFFPPWSPSGLTSLSLFTAAVEVPITAEWKLPEPSNRSKPATLLLWNPAWEAIAASELSAETAS